MNSLHEEYTNYLNGSYSNLKTNFDAMIDTDGVLFDMNASLDDFFTFMQNKAEDAYTASSSIYKFVKNVCLSLNSTFDETYDLWSSEMSTKLDGISEKMPDVDVIYRDLIEDMEHIYDWCKGSKAFVLIGLDLLTQVSGVNL